jgi:hypothetical protein
VTFELAGGKTATGSDPDGDGRYTAAVSGAVTGVEVRDACGNTAG